MFPDKCFKECIRACKSEDCYIISLTCINVNKLNIVNKHIYVYFQFVDN